MSCEAKRDIESVQQFFDYLTSEELPKHWTRRRLKKLKPDHAFEIIYYLQEVLGLLPDTFEMCRGCGFLFDTDVEGTSIDGSDTVNGKPAPKRLHGHWCDNCIPDETLNEDRGDEE